MDLATYLFKEHEQETKRIARGSYNKKRGSRSRKCSLPQDRMTKGEWKKMNGEVKTYNLEAPMTKAEFRSMPSDLKVKYIDNMAAKGARLKDIASMMGYTEGALSNLLSVLYKGKGSPFKHTGNRGMSKEWQCFLNSLTPVEAEPEVKPEPTPEPKVTHEEQTVDPAFVSYNCDFNSIDLKATGNPLIVFAQAAKLINLETEYRVYISMKPVTECEKSLSNF